MFKSRGFTVRFHRLVVIGVALTLTAHVWTLQSARAESDAEKATFFETHVRPLFANHCHECHGAEVQENSLRTDSREALLRGGSRGPALLPGKPADSLLVQALRHSHDELQMPPEVDRLPDDQIAAIERWIAQGAVWPEEQQQTSDSPLDRIDQIRAGHWAFRPITAPVVPALAASELVHNDIDRFVLATLKKVGLSPSGRADRRTLIRRVYFDVLGIPPTFEETEAFVHDSSDEAYAGLIERVLQRHEYGQRWGRHWLDVARYSDSQGRVRDRVFNSPYPYAYTYRDYVIRALNDDLPFDQFVLQQLAADQLDLPESQQRDLAAMGFLTVGRRYYHQQHKIIPERIDLVSRSLLGMTMMCAKCHDHKFDPLSMNDYYALYGVFESSREPMLWDLPAIGEPASPDPRLVASFEQEFKAKRTEFEAARSKVSAEKAETLTDGLRKLHNELEDIVVKYGAAVSPRAMTMLDKATPTNSHVHQRGDHLRLGSVAPRRFLEVLAPICADEPFDQGSGRLQLAKAIVHPQNPLTARVIVNRIWGWHFGNHLVSTPSDFGTRGEPPTHPDLLDYLANRFKRERSDSAGGMSWSLKSLHRLILLSATYCQSSHDRADCVAVDPSNQYLWRANRRRLEFEPMRDAMLAATGELDTQIGGQAFSDIDEPRRSVYFYTNRRKFDAVLTTFDVPVPLATLPKRENTTLPQQSLFLMNSGFAMRRARALVERLDAARQLSGDQQRIEQLYRWTYSRNPTPDELTIGAEFVASDPAQETEVVAGGVLQTSWANGYGEYDVTTRQVISFKPLPQFDGMQWTFATDESINEQGGFLAAATGRPGMNRQRSVIRRFTVPQEGGEQHLIKTTIQPHKLAILGDGFDLWIVSSRHGLLKHVPVDGTEPANVRIERVATQPGDHLDLVVACRDSNEFDDFTWAPIIWHTKNSDSGGLVGIREFRSQKAFENSIPRWLGSLNAWQQYAQVLLISNEFMFVD